MAYKDSSNSSLSASPDGELDPDAVKKEEEQNAKRQSFLAALKKRGLELEVEEPEWRAGRKGGGGEEGEEEAGEEEEGEAAEDPTAGMTFVKVHASWPVLR